MGARRQGLSRAKNIQNCRIALVPDCQISAKFCLLQRFLSKSQVCDTQGARSHAYTHAYTHTHTHWHVCVCVKNLQDSELARGG